MRFFYIILLFLFKLSVFAQYTDTKILNVNNGLLSNNIHAAFVDNDGNLLLGSRAGLAVRNGNVFETSKQTTKYKFNNIYDILEDPNEGKWIAGYGQGVLYFKDNTTKLFSTKNKLAHNTVRTLFYFKEKMYVGTLNGISIINTKNFSVTNPTFTQNKDYLFTVTSFFEVNNKVYATTLNDGIYEVTHTKVQKISDLKKTFSSIVFNNKIYISTNDKLLVLNPQSFKVEKEYPIGNIWKFLIVDDTLYFVSSGIFETDGGLYKISNNQLENLTTTYNLPYTDLKSIAYNKQNQMLYVGTQNNGLMQINLNVPVVNYEQDKTVYCLNTQNNQQFVFHNKGFTLLENNQVVKEIALSTFKQFQETHPSKFQQKAVIQNHFYPIDYTTTASKIVFYSSQIHNNKLWVASNIGMFSLSLQGEILKYYPIHTYYFTFFKNQLVMPVPYGGVRIFKEVDTFSYDYFHDFNNSSIPAEIVSVAQTHEAVYFASALSGLYQYKNGLFQSFAENKSFTELKLKSICTTSSGNLVVVTDFNDVYVIDVRTSTPKIKQQIAHQKIKGSTTFFVNEINGVLYIGTNLGINVFKGNDYYFIDKDQGFTNYNSTKAEVFNNQLFVGTKAGYFVLNNNYFTTKRSFNNKVVVETVYVNNTERTNFSDEKTLTVPYNKNTIRLLFSVPQAKYPNKLKYKFRLKETEPWQELISENQIALNYLKSDDYTVQLQITDEDTGIIKLQTLLHLKVKQPFYYTLPFLLTSLLLVIGAFFAGYKLRINYLKQKQAKDMQLLMLQNDQKTKELLFDKQLADVKLQALKSQMNSHFLFNVLSSIQYFIICKDVDSALYYLEQFSTLIRTTLNYSDKKSITLYEEINYLKQYIEIENLRTEHPILFTTTIAQTLDAEKISIVPLLLQPFVENAIVHAFPPSITQPHIQLLVDKIGDAVQITIADNGIGYQEKKATAHQSKGISIVQTQLQLTQETLSTPIQITSSSAGTTVVILLNNY